MIHPKIDRESQLVQRTWCLLAADLNNVGTRRGTAEEWWSIWRVLVAEAKVLRSWMVNLHPIYQDILDVHFLPPVSLNGDLLRDRAIGGASTASTIRLIDLGNVMQQQINAAVGDIFPICPTLIAEIQHDVNVNQ